MSCTQYTRLCLRICVTGEQYVQVGRHDDEPRCELNQDGMAVSRREEIKNMALAALA